MALDRYKVMYEGLNELDLVELFIGIEDEFDIEFPD